MKTAPVGETKRKQASWRLLVGPLLATAVSALTVLGAILLSLQGQVQSNQVVVQVSRDVTVEDIPTADIATAPPLTLIPSWEATVELSATPTPLATASAPPASPGTTAPLPTFTPFPCAGGAPLHWKLYIVQAGDTLFSLTRRHGTTVDQAVYYNCLQSEQVWAGQRLYLPPLPTPIPSPTPTPTPLPPSPTSAPLPTAAPTWTDTPVPLPTSTGTVVISPTATLTATATPMPSPTPVVTPTATPIPSPTPVVSPTATPMPSPTSVVSPTATSEPIASPTPEPVASPTPEPVASPTPEPIASPTPEPIASPTPEETPEP